MFDARTATPSLMHLLLLIVAVIFVKLVLRPKKKGDDPIIIGAVSALDIVMTASAFIAVSLAFLIVEWEKFQLAQGEPKIVERFMASFRRDGHHEDDNLAEVAARACARRFRCPPWSLPTSMPS